MRIPQKMYLERIGIVIAFYHNLSVSVVIISVLQMTKLNNEKLILICLPICLII